MELQQILAMLVWTVAGGILLFLLMWIDTLFTKYKDIAEIKKGNVAVTTRFVMKLFAQGYILAQSISNANDLWIALLVSVLSFIILLLLEKIAELLLKTFTGLDLERGTQQGMVGHAMVAGSLHVVGALILGALV
ncbi:DUF350 domain-containing protein [Brevibacillus gelatini]|uniref:DUF350 domain-containing protein n=1 Tax=Brevibacillus gelatini TaxID=1655277 RepID=UPI003D815C92